jgi:imidazole glycerol-phosphate synthase subunit HisH
LSVTDVVVIDSGGANLASLIYCLKRLGATAEVSADPARIRAASHVLLPGVGAAHDTMARLTASGLVSVIPQLTQPLLGICLGMQLLYAASEEAAAGAAETAGLGIVPGRVQRIAASPDHPVPHMGWNQLEPIKDDPLFEGIAAGEYVYFVHSFAAPLSADSIVASTYGPRFTAAVRKNNFRGVQFHPERSAGVGAKLLANFLKISE